MNLVHLGDALDFWKGRIISELARSHLIKNTKVIPMFTDGVHWSQSQLKTYSKLLCIANHDSILNSDVTFIKSGRMEYFESICSSIARDGSDLFIDPDIGIATGKTTTEKHVKLSEVEKILQVSPTSLLLIYQHTHQMKSRDLIQDGVTSLKNIGIKAFAYKSNQVGMVFAARNGERLEAVCQHLAEMLGAVAQQRLIC